MKFWPLPLIRNYSTSAEIDQVFRRFAADPTLKVEASDEHYIWVTTSTGKMCFWHANAFYAWANKGFYVLDEQGKRHWQDILPSRAAVRLMDRALARLMATGETQAS